MKASQLGAGVRMGRIDVLTADSLRSIISLSKLSTWVYSLWSVPAVLCPFTGLSGAGGLCRENGVATLAVAKQSRTKGANLGKSWNTGVFEKTLLNAANQTDQLCV